MSQGLRVLDLGICHTKTGLHRQGRRAIKNITYRPYGNRSARCRLPPAEKDGDKRLTYDVPEAGRSLDARGRPGVCDARPLAIRGRAPMNVRQIEVRNDSAVAESAQVPRHFRLAQKLRTPRQPA
jgi:hypothetical protein